ncbi:zinc-binding alcohol dehydrogenase family protein [Uruburuella testudinis]|uniref:Zinc-type alcohol dehydrogenase-like protein n=1 Tax=Uruburuella testudinis TaxID=1282863 RepID=A0ABY4DU84_9NEIS|nr:zinc-binding alcohol dehydrogenase family protein [Uruburuella testudinis]UOO82274.1 zinc-binding alcohol dehydrogenase family protein [Uruburuella testudinis]
MHAVGFKRPLPITDTQSLIDIELPVPTLNPHDLLVEIQAVSVNPADVKIRAAHTPPPGSCRILGFDAAGVVKATGSAVTRFQPGDEVYYAGDISRPGAYAQWQAVDERIAAHKPATLDFAQAAALPLTALTAWETLFDRLAVGNPVAGGADVLLLIGAAGGVGSIAIQLLKALTRTRVIATASRPESRAWVRGLGADFIADHRQPLPEQVAALGIGAPAYVFSTSHTDSYLPQIVDLITPQGRIALIDDPGTLDANPLKSKSLSLHWEFMFTRPLYHTADMARQGEILQQVADLADTGNITSTLNHTFHGINAANLREAHAMIERGDMVGKVVLSGWTD